MAMTKTIDAIPVGKLANNGITVLGLQTQLSRGETDLNSIPKIIMDVAREESWRAFILGANPDHVFRWGPADFRKFIEAPRPDGCETPIYMLERMLRGTEAWETFLELTRGKPGGQEGNQNAANEDKTNCDIITVRFPIEPNTPPPTGTSVSYALRRLKREREDLYDQVKAGELTANRAMIEAGFRKVPTPYEIAQKAYLKMDANVRKRLRAWQDEQDNAGL